MYFIVKCLQIESENRLNSVELCARRFLGNNERAEGSPIEERERGESEEKRNGDWAGSAVQCWHANKGNEIRHSRRERKARTVGLRGRTHVRPSIRQRKEGRKKD